MGKVAHCCDRAFQNQSMIESSGILRSRPMPPPSDRPVEIKLLVNPASPDLLEGLESWLQLNLISDWQVRQLSQQQLTCRLPQPIATETAATAAAVAQAATAAIMATGNTAGGGGAASNDLLNGVSLDDMEFDGELPGGLDSLCR